MHKITKKRIIMVRSFVDALKDIEKTLGASGEVKPSEVKALNEIISLVRKDSFGHYLSLSNDPSSTNISYCKMAEHKYDIPKRVMTSPGRYFSKHFTEHFEKISAKCLDRFVCRFGVHLNKASVAQLDSRIQILRGKAIKEHYKGTEVHSCMTGPHNTYKLNLYELNPEKCGLVILDGQIRALLWTTDSGQTILDRAYPSGHNKIDQIRLWAESKGYLLRVDPDKNIVDQTIAVSDGGLHKVTLKHSGCFPFMDMFRYANFEKNNTVICSNDFEFGNIKFNTDQGSYVEVIRCIKCGTKQAKAREVLINGELDAVCMCDDCYHKMFFRCGNCGKSFATRNLAIPANKNRKQRHYCKKCALNMQKFVQFSECSCEQCTTNKRAFKEIFESAGMNINEDVTALNDYHPADMAYNPDE